MPSFNWFSCAGRLPLVGIQDGDHAHRFLYQVLFVGIAIDPGGPALYCLRIISQTIMLERFIADKIFYAKDLRKFMSPPLLYRGIFHLFPGILELFFIFFKT